MSTLARYYARLEGREPGDPLELVSDEVRFAISLPDARFAGGRAELRSYIDARGPTRRHHHIVHRSREGAVEYLVGEVHDDGAVQAGFVAGAEFDAAGRLWRYLVTMSADVTFASSSTGAGA
jgi:hypothetical protein